LPKKEEALMASWSDVRKIALEFPGATEGTAFGNAAWSVNKKCFVWERPLRKSDLAALGAKAPKGPILGVRTPDLEMKDLLLASDPKIFFTTPHFDGYPAVLVRLDKIGVKRLRDVIAESWLSRAGKRAVTEYLRAKSR
jgi:hypothetical protein